MNASKSCPSKHFRTIIKWLQRGPIIQSITECPFEPFYKEFVGAVSVANGIAINGPLQYYGLSKFLVPKNRVSNGDDKERNHYFQKVKDMRSILTDYKTW